MSPSEFDLRAALRDGEGDDAPDVDGLLTHVHERRAQRRVRLLSAAAAVVVVAGAAVGGAALWGGSDGGPSPAARSTTPTVAGPSRPGTSDPGTSNSGTSNPGTSDARPADAACPASAPGPVDPPGLRPATSPKKPMFTAPVQTLLVCSYTDAAAPKRVTLTGSSATAVTDSIEAASADRLKIVCPDIATGETTLLALVPVAVDGSTLPTVVTDISVPDCNEPITNGTAVRYNWRPPADLRAALAR